MKEQILDHHSLKLANIIVMLNGTQCSEASGLRMRRISGTMDDFSSAAQILRFAQDDRETGQFEQVINHQ